MTKKRIYADLRELFYLRLKGYNNAKIAEMTGIGRYRVQDILRDLRNLSDEEFDNILIRNKIVYVDECQHQEEKEIET